MFLVPGGSRSARVIADARSTTTPAVSNLTMAVPPVCGRAYPTHRTPEKRAGCRLGRGGRGGVSAAEQPAGGRVPDPHELIVPGGEGALDVRGEPACPHPGAVTVGQRHDQP